MFVVVAHYILLVDADTPRPYIVKLKETCNVRFNLLKSIHYMSRVYALAQTVPPDVLLVNPVIVQETSTELGGWLNRFNVQGYYTTRNQALTSTSTPSTGYTTLNTRQGYTYRQSHLPSALGNIREHRQPYR